VNLIVFVVVNTGIAFLGSNHRRLRLRARAEKQHLETVIADLDHRLKHVLSVAQDVSVQVAERTEDIRQFQDAFQERLNSLARSHELLVKRNWSSVNITDVIGAQLLPFNHAHQITIEGETVFLNPTATEQIGLALYELASSSTKYGALKKGGHVRFSWRVLQDSILQLLWQESGTSHVPAVVAHVMLTTVVPKTLRGTASLAESADGLTWRLSIHPDFYSKSKLQELSPAAYDLCNTSAREAGKPKGGLKQLDHG
jgi:two-component sensor histidine kinase